ncbi:MAG: hypothetical protein IK086_00375 [Clostridia bacterium]|nr:hypothetical protein [Clostridia bacterium]
MKDSAKSKIAFSVLQKLLSLCLVLLLFICGCADEPDTGKTTPAKKPDTPSNTEVEDEPIDPLLGDISYEITKTSSKPRDDADEIRFSGNPAGLSNPLVGKYDKQASELRTKILNSANTETIYKITGKKYYISPGGSDDNDGRSAETPFRTVDALSNVDFDKGDAVLFERGAIFRLIQPLSTVAGVTYGSYGTGDKPKLYASPMNFANVEWTPSSRKNIWKAKYVFDDVAGVVFDNGKEIGYRKTSVRNLTANTHFFQDVSGAVIYLYCDKGNPSKVYKSIEVCPDMFLISIPAYTSNVIIDNLCLKYSGSIAVSAVYNNNNITVSNCEIGFSGGANKGSVRYGNAIQAWTNSSNFVVKGNYIYQTFDTAVTWQGEDVDNGKNIEYANCLFEGNLLEYNNADFEFWHSNGTVNNFIIRNNICRFTSLGWGTRADDGGYRGIEGFIYAKTSNMTYKNKISVLNNIIDCPGRQFVNWTATEENIANHVVSGNKVYVKKSYRTADDIIRNYNCGLTGFADADALKAALELFDKTVVCELAE